MSNGSATPMRGKSTTCRDRFPFSKGLRPSGHRPLIFGKAPRQVVDLPRIGVARPEPVGRPVDLRIDFKS